MRAFAPPFPLRASPPPLRHPPVPCAAPPPVYMRSDVRLRAGSSARPPARRAAAAASLTDITDRIAGLLHVGGLTDYGGRDLLCPRDKPATGRGGEGKWHVVVVFGKGLCEGDRLGVEYAKRVVVLVKQIACGGVKVDTLCFAGGRRKDGVISEAAAGYLFFRQVAEEAGVDVSGIDFVFEEGGKVGCDESESEAMANLVARLKGRYGAESVSRWYVTLVSSDYDLIRIQEVHRTCPRRSMLFALEVEGVSWTSLFAAYPFSVSPDATTVFLGRAIVLANDLDIILVNVRAVLTDRQFLSRENLARLNATSAAMRDMYRVVDRRQESSERPAGRPVRVGFVENPGLQCGFRGDMRESTEVLEMAIGAVREVQRLLAPTADPSGGSVSRTDLERAVGLLSRAVGSMRKAMDPDRPLKVADQMDIAKDMEAFVVKHGRERSGYACGKVGGGYQNSHLLGGRAWGADVPASDVLRNGGPKFEGSGENSSPRSAVPESDTVELPIMTTADIQRGFRMPAPSPTPSHSLLAAEQATTAAAVVTAERYFAVDGGVSGNGDGVLERPKHRSRKRIARDGPHLILVDDDEFMAASDALVEESPVAAIVDTTPAQHCVTPQVGKVTENDAEIIAAPGRRRKATAGVANSTSAAIGTKRRAPAKRTASTTRATRKTSKPKVKATRTTTRTTTHTAARTGSTVHAAGRATEVM